MQYLSLQPLGGHWLQFSLILTQITLFKSMPSHFTQYFEAPSSVLSENGLELLLHAVSNIANANHSRTSACVEKQDCAAGLNWFWSAIYQRLFNSDRMTFLKSRSEFEMPCAALFATCEAKNPSACGQAKERNLASAGNLNSDWLNISDTAFISQDSLQSFPSLIYSICFGNSTLISPITQNSSSHSNLIPASPAYCGKLGLNSEKTAGSSFTDYSSNQRVFVNANILSKLQEFSLSSLSSSDFPFSSAADRKISEYSEEALINLGGVSELSGENSPGFLSSSIEDHWSVFKQDFVPYETAGVDVCFKISDYLCPNLSTHQVTSKGAELLCSTIIDSIDQITLNFAYNSSSKYLSALTSFEIEEMRNLNSSSMVMSNVSDLESTAGSPDPMSPMFWFWLVVGFLMVIMSLMTTLGNMLVIVSFIYESKLRTVSNFYILNLAIADFLIGKFKTHFMINYFLGVFYLKNFIRYQSRLKE